MLLWPVAAQHTVVEAHIKDSLTETRDWGHTLVTPRHSTQPHLLKAQPLSTSATGWEPSL